MPTYEYVCEKCGAKFEQFQSINARPLRKCKQCGKNGLKRLIGCGAGVIFKGSGFYETDYRSDSYNQARKKEQGEKTDAGKKAEDKPKKATEKSGTSKSEDKKKPA